MNDCTRADAILRRTSRALSRTSMSSPMAWAVSIRLSMSSATPCSSAITGSALRAMRSASAFCFCASSSWISASLLRVAIGLLFLLGFRCRLGLLLRIDGDRSHEFGVERRGRRAASVRQLLAREQEPRHEVLHRAAQRGDVLLVALDADDGRRDRRVVAQEIPP